MTDFLLRTLRPDEWSEVAELIHVSTNDWFQAHGKPAVFAGPPSACELFPQVYETLDPGCCLVVEERGSGGLVASCFYHPRPTHVSVGIVNVHPAYFGQGLARRMMDRVIEIAGDRPVRLVSSASNMDSFSLYTRAGFAPRALYQLMLLTVPEDGLGEQRAPRNPRLRAATPLDVAALTGLEKELVGIDREKDYRYILERSGEGDVWHATVLESADGSGLDGFLVSVKHPGSESLGPGVARTDAGAADLIRAELDSFHRGRTLAFMVPAARAELVAAMYALGARNVDLSVHQVRGAWSEPAGVVLPTFMPETG